jgi:hypothetical protein
LSLAASGIVVIAAAAKISRITSPACLSRSKISGYS